MSLSGWREWLLQIATAAALCVLGWVHPAKAQDKTVCDVLRDGIAQERWDPDRKGVARKTVSTFASNAFVRNGVFDVDGDGVSETVGPAPAMGTARNVNYNTVVLSSRPQRSLGSSDHWKSMSEAERAIENDYSRWATAWAWLSYKNHWYEVGFSDTGGGFPLVARYYDRSGARHMACAFQSAIHELQWVGTSSDPTVARRAQTCITAMSSGPPPVLPPTETIASEAAEALIRRAKTHVVLAGLKASGGNIWNVDFDNDGQADRLAQIILTGGAGRGYDAEYYLLLAANGSIDRSKKQDLLRVLQEMDVNDMYPIRPGGLELTWVSLGGQVYLQRRYHDGITSTEALAHDLREARDGRTDFVCGAVLAVTPQMMYAAPPED